MDGSPRMPPSFLPPVDATTVVLRVRPANLACWRWRLRSWRIVVPRGLRNRDGPNIDRFDRRGREHVRSRARHRGTSIGDDLGKDTLAADDGVIYLPEPFNLDHLYPGLCGARFPSWFMHIDAETAQPYRDDIARMLRLEFCWRDARAAAVRSPRAGIRAAQIARVL